MINSIGYTTARDNLSEMMERVCTEHEPIIITRESKPAVVIMSLEDYQALEETSYLLRSPNNAQRLLESIAELEAGGGKAKELIEPFK